MSRDTDVTIGIFLGMFLGAVISGLACSSINDGCWQKELIQKDKAEWVIDSKTGIKEFKLKDCNDN